MFNIFHTTFDCFKSGAIPFSHNEVKKDADNFYPVKWFQVYHKIEAVFQFLKYVLYLVGWRDGDT